MATIGTFTAADSGYAGSVKTLTLSFRAKFVPTEKDNDKAPDYRIFAGATECGAAWKKTARDSDREYLSVKLDDPSFSGADLRLAGERRGRRQLQSDLVPSYSRIIRRDRHPRPASSEAGFSRAGGHNSAEGSGRRPSVALFTYAAFPSI